MNQNKRQIAIKLDMTIDDNGEMEYNTVRETGHFFHKNGRDVLIYNEEDTAIKNLVTIQSDKVTIKRTGSISMNQQFYPNQITESLYRHAHGKIHMETFTDSISYESMKTDGLGKLSIFYTVKLNGIDDRKHVMTLTYQEEDSK